MLIHKIGKSCYRYTRTREKLSSTKKSNLVEFNWTVIENNLMIENYLTNFSLFKKKKYLTIENLRCFTHLFLWKNYYSQQVFPDGTWRWVCILSRASSSQQVIIWDIIMINDWLVFFIWIISQKLTFSIKKLIMFFILIFNIYHKIRSTCIFYHTILCSTLSLSSSCLISLAHLDQFL